MLTEKLTKEQHKSLVILESNTRFNYLADKIHKM